MHFFKSLKKMMILFLSVLAISSIGSSNLYAQSDSSYLKTIADNTTAILEKVNNLPNYLSKMTEFALSWLSADDSDETAKMQANFASLGQSSTNNIKALNDIQRQLAADLVDQPTNDFLSPAQNPKILSILPNVNDLMYASMTGNKPAPNGAFSPYNYIKYASGLALDHQLPRANWQGSEPAKKRYTSWYNAIIAVESFDSYILSQLYAENKNGNQMTAMQNDLIKQASSADWLTKVASEELGKVLRQILIFQSQSYVVLTQLLQTEKQLLTATAMTNTVLIANNQINENALVSTARGVAPRL